MTEKEMMLKIIQLQEEIMTLRKQLAEKPTYIPYVSNPFISTPDVCTDGKWHDYPSPWFGTVPPNCNKCGKPATAFTVTCTTS